MPWVPPLVAAVWALALGLATPAVLRRLPEPLDDPDAATKLPYAALATPAMAVGVGAASFAAGTLAFLAAPVELWLAWTALSTVGVLSAAIDLRTTWLPLPLARVGWVVAAAGVVVAAAVRSEPGPLVWAAVGAFGLWALFEVVWRATGGIGYGDVRLMATVGAVTGAHDPTLVLPSALAGTVVGVVWGLAHRLRTGADPFPYAPALLTGPFAALAWWWLAR